MKLKKIAALMLSFALGFALFAGCGSAPAEQTNAPTAEPAAPAPQPQSPAPAPAAPAAQPETPAAELEAPALEPIKIGHIVDLTGIEGMLGEQYKSALEYAVESLGGEFAGRPVEIVIGDAQNQPAVAADTARKMVEVDKVSAIFGPTQIGQKGAVAEYVKEAGIPLIFYNPTPEMMIQDNKWLVGANGGIPQMPTTMADYAYNDLGYRTVHTITLDNMGARMFIDGFTEPFTAMGGTVVSQQWAPAPVGDWAPYLATLSDADALVVWCSSTDAISFWNAYYEMGVYERFPVITPMHGGFVDYFVAEAVNAINPAAAELMLNTYASIMYVRDIDSPENAEYVAGWNKAFGHDPLFCEGSVPQAVYLLNSALEATGGDTSPDRLIEAIFDADFTGPEGHQFFNESQIATKDVYIAKVVKLANGGFSYETVKSYKDVPPAGLSK